MSQAFVVDFSSIIQISSSPRILISELKIGNHGSNFPKLFSYKRRISLIIFNSYITFIHNYFEIFENLEMNQRAPKKKVPVKSVFHHIIRAKLFGVLTLNCLEGMMHELDNLIPIDLERGMSLSSCSHAP